MTSEIDRLEPAGQAAEQRLKDVIEDRPQDEFRSIEELRKKTIPLVVISAGEIMAVRGKVGIVDHGLMDALMEGENSFSKN